MDNVYLYVHDLRSSGVVRMALTLASRMALDHPTTLIAGYAEGFFFDQAARGPFAFEAIAAKPGRLPRVTAAWRLRRWLGKRPPGVLMSVGNMGHVTPYFACRGLDRIARVYCISNEVARGDGLRSALRIKWMDMLVRDATRIILVGRTLRRIGCFDRALRAGLAVEIPNGVEVDRARASAIGPAPQAWLTEDVPVVLGIGRLRPQKNFDLLIEAVRRARHRTRLRLIIIGGGTAAEHERLSALAEAAGLGGDFMLAGETDNVFAWLARAKAFALSSRWEGSSLVLLEALAMGVPTVASRLAGDAAQVLDDGRYGLLFDGRDPDALAEALLVQCSEEPVRPGARAEAYDMKTTVDSYARLIDEILAKLATPVAGAVDTAPRTGLP